MGVAPDPQEIYDRAEDEGERRLEMPPLEQVATGFIAGVTIVFGIVAQGVVKSLVEPEAGRGLADLAGALAFGIGVVFLVVGRSELFTENFFDPVASALDTQRRGTWRDLGRLWLVTYALNLVGGAVLVAVIVVPGALPEGAPASLVHLGEEVAGKAWTATLARAVLAGALITLLSYMLNAVDSVRARIGLAYMTGFLLALGPFDHVVVSALHLLAAIWLGGPVGYMALGENLLLATVGNLVGGLLLITLTHTAQVKGSRGSRGGQAA